MIRDVRVHGPNDSDVVDGLSHVRKQLADFDATFTVLAKLKRRLERRVRLAFRSRQLERQLLAVILGQHRFRIEGIDMRRPTVHEQVDDAANLGRKVGHFRTQWISGRGCSGLSQDVSQHQGAHAHAASRQHVTARNSNVASGRIVRRRERCLHIEATQIERAKLGVTRCQS